MMLGGAKFVYEAPGGHLIDGIVHCCGPIDHIEEWWLNDINSGIAANTSNGPGTYGGLNIAAPWQSNIEIESHYGKTFQAASPILLSKLPDIWTDQHQLNGLCYSVLRLGPVAEKNFQKVYNTGAPSLRVLAYMTKLDDPRDGTHSWKPNPSLAILHYLTASRGTDAVTGKAIPVGYGIPMSRIDVDSFKAFAYLCEEPVAQKDGSTLARYEVNGTFDLGQDDRKDVLASLIATCDAELYQAPDGTISIRGGQWTEPTVTITDEHILAYDCECDTDKLAAFNRLKVIFTDPQNDYQQVEAEPWDDETNQALTGQVLTQDLSLPMCQSFSQARRIAKIAMAKGNPRWKLTLTTDLYGLLVLGERIVHVTLADLGIDETFLVTSFVQAADSVTCQIGLTSLDASAYEWDPAEDEGTGPAVAGDTTVVINIPAVTGATITTGTTGGDNANTTLVATAPDPGMMLELHGRYRRHGTTDPWIDMDTNGLETTSGAVDSGLSFDVELAYWAPYGGTEGPWSAPQTIST